MMSELGSATNAQQCLPIQKPKTFSKQVSYILSSQSLTVCVSRSTGGVSGMYDAEGEIKVGDPSESLLQSCQ